MILLEELPDEGSTAESDGAGWYFVGPLSSLSAAGSLVLPFAEEGLLTRMDHKEVSDLAPEDVDWVALLPAFRSWRAAFTMCVVISFK